MKNKSSEVLNEIDGPTSKMFSVTGFTFECKPEAPRIHDLLEMHRCSVLERLLITNYFESVSGQCCGCNAITRIPSGLVPRSACKLKKKVVFCVISKTKSNTKTLSDQKREERTSHKPCLYVRTATD